MSMRIAIISAILIVGTHLQVAAQGKKVWASGAARSIFQQDRLDSEGDTVTPNRLNSGHALVDLAINARPNEQTFLHAMLRIRNDFGGFWGSGVTFDMRQLYLKGLIRNAVRYQVGDINYKLSPYTFYNHEEELSDHRIEALQIYRDLTRYDLFYTNDHTWRQQGAAVDFSIVFPAMVDELQMNLFSFRNRPTDFGNQSDRLFWGGNATLVQSNKLQLGMNYVDLMDIAGTSRNDQVFHNPVVTGTTRLNHSIKGFDLLFSSESGISEMYMLNDPQSKTLRDYFADLNFSVSRNDRSKIALSYINVGPQFRSVGAQRKRINFEAQNRLYTRVGNEQMVRPITLMDMIQDASLYQMTLNPGLDAFAPQYDNVMPFGVATPNRKGFGVELQHQTANHLLKADLAYRALSEVVGQGTDDLRTFGLLQANVVLKLDTLIPTWNRALELSASYTGRNTNRSNALPEATIDLISNMTDIGLKLGVIKDMDLLANYRILNADGNELLPVRNDYSEVIDFNPFRSNMKQDHLILALRYHFDAKNKLNVVWQRLNYNDKAAEVPDFSIQQFGIVYSMFF